MIGIIGYGMVGRAVEYGFPKCSHVISDPQFNTTTTEEVCAANPEAIFVCVPTPTHDSDYAILKDVLDRIKQSSYQGLTVVKSTILPHHLEGYNVLYNPEFLSRKTSFKDFIDPPFILIGGNKAKELLNVYIKYSVVNQEKVFLTDIKTASLAKYTMNSFYAVKITYMNEIYNIAQDMGVNYADIATILSNQPWMGTHHFQVPGPDGQRGFGGPCLPKDTEAFAKEYPFPLLDLVLAINKEVRINLDL